MKDQDLPLFQQESPQSVSEVTARIKGSLESQFSHVWVKGEISNLKLASSGHLYCSLKDEGATISVAAFGWVRKNKATGYELKDGLEVFCRGSISVYAPRGGYQLIADSIEPVGAGALQLAFEKLKLKLKTEGLFDADRKKALPEYPKKIIVITSPQAAALRDVLTVLKRRAPFVEVILVPALVQGEEASRKIIQAIRVANHYRLGDVILLTRGGGSMEDLWAFNDEELARTISESELPIVSAVGHEVDFTISDFVADLRAPTPSAGAEILTQHWVELKERSIQLNSRLMQGFRRELQAKRRALEALSVRVRGPRDLLREKMQRCDELSLSLEKSMSRIIERRKSSIQVLQARLKSPKDQIRNQYERSAEARLKLDRGMKLILERKKSRLETLSAHLDAISPLKVLARGYSLVQSDPEGGGPRKLVRSARGVNSQQKLILRFSDGEIKVVAQ